MGRWAFGNARSVFSIIAERMADLFPQGLKPIVFIDLFGTTEVVL
jgi:hypothetical protein